MASRLFPTWLASCIHPCACGFGAKTGCDLTSLFGETAVPHTDAAKVSLPYKKHGWLPVLTVLFVLSYGLMTLLIVEQGSTIESQRALIRELFQDSTELSAGKGKAVRDKNALDAKRRAQAPSANSQPGQSSSADSLSNQSSSNESASNQAAQRRAAKKPQLTMPSRPAADIADDRRSLITI
jgi:cytoskeletal protein RodZ